MTPTLNGRIQTRIFAVLGIGLPWLVLLGPVLGGTGDAGIGEVYRSMLLVLLLMGFLGVAWELAYHGLQQFRWEKDWPTLLGLLTGVTEAIVLYPVARAAARAFDVLEPSGTAFLWHFITTWLLIWAILGGPIRIVSLRWRFFGGRLL